MAEPAGELPPLAAEPPAIPEPAAEPVAEPVLEPVAQPAAPNQADDRIKLLEDKLKALEDRQGLDVVTTALASVRNALLKPESIYDPWEASSLVEALVRAARSSAHEKADHYAAILDELKGRSSVLSPSAHRKLLLGLLGDPVRAKDFAVALQEVLSRPKPGIVWCDINGEPLSFVGPTVSAELVSKDPSLGNLAHLRFRHPDYFQAGSLHDHVDFWEHLISSTGYVCPQVNLLQIIREGVRVHDFFRHFKGNFKAGYFVNLAKSSPEPSTFVRFLGFISDSIVQAFFIPPDKKEKFRALREELLGSSCAPVKSLQRFAGKALSFSLAIPACKLYVREVFKAIAVVAKNSKISVPIQGPLRQELQEWTFLDNWSGHLPWRSEHHLSVTMFSDASQRAWGAVLVKDGLSQQIRDYWTDLEDDINVLEARALCNALSSLFPSIKTQGSTYGRIT
ncbi:hypothetical protein ACROYT_G042229 [Oculina patagonica]